ncbi:MAG: hypothetical protein V1916_02125, partial [Patescibacteria group bacterium]
MGGPSINFGGGIQSFFTALLGNPAFPLVLVGVSVLIVLLAAVFLLRRYLRSQKALPQLFQKVMLMVTVPKEAQLRDDEGQREKPVAELLVQAEAWFAALGGMRAQRGLGTYLAGRYDTFSLEIVVHRGLIEFYVTVPRYLREYLEQHIHAQYPSANIEEVGSYNLFGPASHVAATALTFRKPFIFPIRTYRQLDVDPLNSLTNVLSKIGEGESAAIQYVVRSAKAEWHNWGARVSREMHQGKTLKEAMGHRGFTGFLMELVRTFVPKKKTEDEYGRIRPLSPREEEIAKSIEEKTSKAGLDANVRLVVSASSPQRAEDYLRNIVDSFSQYTLYEYGNGFQRRNPWRKDALLMD